MEIEVTAFIYVLILGGDPGNDAYSYVCLTLSPYKTLFSVAYTRVDLQAYKLPQATYYLFIYYFISFDKNRCLPVPGTQPLELPRLIQECAVTEAVLIVVETFMQFAQVLRICNE